MNNKISIEWQVPNAPPLSAMAAAKVITDSGSHDLVLPLNHSLEVDIEGEGTAILSGIFPSGQPFQKFIELGSGGSTQDITIGGKMVSPTEEAPGLVTQRLLGTYRSMSVAGAGNPVSAAETAAEGPTRNSWEEGIWLRLWTTRPGKSEAFEWKSETMAKSATLKRFPEGLMVCLRGLPVTVGRYLEMGHQGSLSRFVAVPPVSNANAVIRPSMNDSIPEVNRGLTMKVVAADTEYSLIESAIQYVVGGSTAEAAVLCQSFVKANGWSNLDPHVCAAVAYFLLRTGQTDVVGQFVEELNMVEDWLPDSAALLARYLMATSPKDKRIGGLMMEAGYRGIPLFSEGLRFQFDYLRTLDANPGFPSKGTTAEIRREVARQIKALGSYISASHQAQVMTTFYGLNPWCPTMDHLLATPNGDRSFVSRLTEEK